MEELRQTIQERGIRYQLEGDYYLPVLELPEENRPIGRWGRLHKAYLKNYRPILYQSMLLSGKLYTVLADLNEQTAERCSLIIRQMAEAVIPSASAICRMIRHRSAACSFRSASTV